MREGTPAQLKAELRERLGLTSDPTLDDVFLDATGRTRGRVAGDVQEVTAMTQALGARTARAARGVADARGAAARRCSSRCSSSSSTSARPAKIFPSTSTDFLHGQGYGAFQLPSSLLLAASFGTAALFLVEDIEGGYFDKLRAGARSRAPRSCWAG